MTTSPVQALRSVTVWLVLVVAVMPTLPLVFTIATDEVENPLWTRSFLDALGTSLVIGGGVVFVSLLIGFPLGLLAGLYRFAGRWPLILLQAAPLLLPSFLLAIGWSNLGDPRWFPEALVPRGLAGVVFVLGFQGVPLPFFVSFAASQSLTASQIDAARLHGGELSVLRLAARACIPAATLSAVLAGVLSLSDPGAALIFGCRPVAVEILTSFSALFDTRLAASQCLVLAALVIALAAGALIVGLPSLADAVLARQTRGPAPYVHRTLRHAAPLALAAVFTLAVGLPTLGLCLPAARDPMWTRAFGEIQRTVSETLFYAATAAAIAVFLSTSLALAAGNSRRLRLLVLGVLLTLFSLPPSLAALGVAQTATHAPATMDWLTRSRFTVGLLLGLRFLPIATLMMMRATGSLSPSWMDAARLHGVSAIRFMFRVIVPVLKTALLVTVVLVMVLATADITTVLLLHPPGRASLPVAIFTVMANSPEGLVASLCLLYLAGVIVVTVAATELVRWWAGRTP